MAFLRWLFSPVIAVLDFITKYFKTVVFLFIVFLILGGSEPVPMHNLAKIEITGEIFDATEVVEQIDEAASNEMVKGALIIMNSPGGAVAPSIEISEAIKRLNASKPTVVYGLSAMASGGYYSSIWASKIVANPGCLIGSIGVVMESADISELMDKLGIKSQSIAIGKYKEAGTPLRQWNADEKAELTKIATGIYDEFVAQVVLARKLKIEDKATFADAHVFNPKEAKALGLIDEIGSIAVAKAELVKLSGVDEAIWQEKSEMDKFWDEFAQSAAKIAFQTFMQIKM